MDNGQTNDAHGDQAEAAAHAVRPDDWRGADDVLAVMQP